MCFHGLDPAHNGGRDPLDASLRAQFELTLRFSAEFSIRPFLIHAPAPGKKAVPAALLQCQRAAATRPSQFVT